MTALYGKKIAPFHLPIREDEKFVGYINVVSEKAYRWQGKEVVECDIPDYSKSNLQICGIHCWKRLRRPAKSSWTAISAG